MTRFLGESTVYFIERVNVATNEERLMTYDEYNKSWTPVSDYRQADGKEDLEYLRTTAQGFREMEKIKVQFGLVSETEFEYNIIQKDDFTYRIDAEGNKIEIEQTELEPSDDTQASGETVSNGETVSPEGA